MLFIPFVVSAFASLSLVRAAEVSSSDTPLAAPHPNIIQDDAASPTGTPAVVTATRLVKGLAETSPFFITSTQIIVWTQTPEATPAA